MTNSKIISVSRRTDIPAFYSEWFMNGIKRGYVDSINPFNRKYVSRISLAPEDVICFVFWTKNPKPMMKYLDILDSLGYKYYFQFTLTAYSQDIEKLVPSKANVLLDTFIELSEKIGKEKIIWRYDPILLNEKYTVEYHLTYFERLVKILHPYTNQVVISFIDLYLKTERNNKGIKEINEETIHFLAKHFAKIASEYGLEIKTCSEKIDLESDGIKHGKCIDEKLVGQIINQPDFDLKKDKGQRKECGCIESIDLGANNTCQHFCSYCYANQSINTVEKHVMLYDPHSTLLCGKLSGDEDIIWRNGKNVKISE